MKIIPLLAYLLLISGSYGSTYKKWDNFDPAGPVLEYILAKVLQVSCFRETSSVSQRLIDLTPIGSFLPSVNKIKHICKQATHKLLDILDTQFPSITEFKDFYPVHFRKLLFSFEESDEVKEYLIHLSSYLENLDESGSKGNLWKFTANYTGDNDKALEWIAVLFQDNTNLAQLTNHSNKELINVTHMLNNPKYLDNLKLFPDYVSSNEKSLHHFYIIAYVTSILIKEFKNEDISFVLPNLLITYYEKYLDRIVHKRIKNKKGDRFLGFAGSMWAISGLADVPLLLEEDYLDNFWYE